jgi:ATP-binding cassette, subfamily B, bacterial
MAAFPIFKQTFAMDCGPTCLRMIFKYYGKEIAIEKIRKETQLGTTGVSLLGMSEAAEKFGFRTTCARITFDQLIKDASLPCVLHWEQQHFVVLTPKANRKRMIIADPARGMVTYSKQEFLYHWLSVHKDPEQKGIALILAPTQEFFQQEEDKQEKVSWTLLFNYVRQYKAQAFQLIVGLLLGSLLQLIFPFLTQSIVDTGINTHNLQFIQMILVAQFALFFGRSVIEFIRSRILLFVSTHINLSILADFWIKLMQLPFSFFETRQSGDILQRINDHHRIENFITSTALQTLFSVVNLLVFSIVLILYDDLLFAIFLCGSLLYFGWIWTFLKHRRTLDYKKFAAASKENSITMELIQGMQEIKLNDAEHLKRWRWEEVRAKLFRLNFSSLSLNQYQQTGAFFINEGKNILVTYLAAKSVLEGDLTLGAMVAIQYIVGQLNSPVEQLIGFAQQAQDAKLSLERLNEIQKMENEEPAGEQFVRSLPSDHSLSFRNFSFTYWGAGNTSVLDNINLVIPQGKITAIVGTSGSGKTTLLKLLLKFYDSYQGEIKVGESNLRRISPKFWRRQCGSVMQDSFIFSDTVANNIAVGDEMPDYEKLLEACRVANILDVVESLPLGFDTKIGAEGNGLSAGQRQRLLIARAVYKDPYFLFFDEATSSLDANNERIIMTNLLNYFRERTVIIVAHRLSTVKGADNIIVLKNGKVIEQGNHDKLTMLGGDYFDLVKNQLELGN